MNDDSDMQRIIHDLEIDTASEGHATDNGAPVTNGNANREFRSANSYCIS